MNDEKCKTVGMVEASVRYKHQELDQAILDSHSVQLRIRSLIERIEGIEEVEGEECDVKRTIPSLHKVLCTGAGDIRESTNLAHDAISALEEMLF